MKVWYLEHSMTVCCVLALLLNFALFAVGITWNLTSHAIKMHRWKWRVVVFLTFLCGFLTSRCFSLALNNMVIYFCCRVFIPSHHTALIPMFGSLNLAPSVVCWCWKAQESDDNLAIPQGYVARLYKVTRSRVTRVVSWPVVLFCKTFDPDPHHRLQVRTHPN